MIAVAVADSCLQLGPGSELCLLQEARGEWSGTVAGRVAEPSPRHARAVAVQVQPNVYEVWYRAPVADVGAIRRRVTP